MTPYKYDEICEKMQESQMIESYPGTSTIDVCEFLSVPYIDQKFRTVPFLTRFKAWNTATSRGIPPSIQHTCTHSADTERFEVLKWHYNSFDHNETSAV